MTTRLTLICQGATIATRRSAFPDDEPLDSRASCALRRARPMACGDASIAVSPMRAACQTAEALGLPVTLDTALHDIDYGDWAGRSIADLGRHEPASLARWLSDPDFDGHGGESLNSLLRRTTRWIEERAGRGGHTIAVAQGTLVRAMTVTVLGAPVEAFWRIDTPPLTLSDLRHDGRRWALRACGCPLPGKRCG